MGDPYSNHSPLLASDIASLFTNDNAWLFQALASHPSDLSGPLPLEVPINLSSKRPNLTVDIPTLPWDTAANVVSGFTITPDISEMRSVFQKFDENNDGLICSQDLRSFMSRLGFVMSEEETRLMLEGVNHDQDGRVNFDEFLSLYKSLCDGESTSSASCSSSDMDAEKYSLQEEDSSLLEAFRVFDRNRDGVITAEELQSVLLELAMPEGKSLRSCERMIETVDKDGNGVIDIFEFKQMMCSNYAFC